MEFSVAGLKILESEISNRSGEEIWPIKCKTMEENAVRNIRKRNTFRIFRFVVAETVASETFSKHLGMVMNKHED